MRDDEVKIIKGKLNFYMENQIKVHIMRNDKEFWNGYIVNKQNEDVFNFEDDKFGKMFLFAVDVYKVSEFKKGDKGDGKA